MAINPIEMDRAESQKFAETFRQLIEPNRCYDNIANIALGHPNIQRLYPGLLVSYGGIQIFPAQNLYARHIVFLHKKKAIDPTLALAEGGVKEGIHYLPIQTMAFQEYVDYLLEHKETSPPHILKKMDRMAAEWLKEDVLLIG